MAKTFGSRMRLAAGVAIVAVAAYFAIPYWLRPTVQVATIKPGRAIKAVSANLLVKAARSIALRSEVGGKLLTQLQDGYVVKEEGEVLAKFNDFDARQRLDEAEGALKTANARYELTKEAKAAEMGRREKEIERQQNAKDRGDITPQALEQYLQGLEASDRNWKNTVIDTENSLANQQRSVRQLTHNLEELVLKAAFVGTITNVLYDQGSLVPGQETIATLISNERIVEASFSEENFSQGIEVGQSIRGSFNGSVDYFTGKVIKVLPAPDAKTGRYTAHLKLDVDDAKLRKTGTGGTAVVTLDERDAKALAPRRALVGGKYLYVVKDGRVRKKEVKVGYVSEKLVEILSGIEADEQVISDDLLAADGGEAFHDGQRVKVAPAATK